MLETLLGQDKWHEGKRKNWEQIMSLKGVSLTKRLKKERRGQRENEQEIMRKKTAIEKDGWGQYWVRETERCDKNAKQLIVWCLYEERYECVY